MIKRLFVCAVLAATTPPIAATPGHAADKLHVGKAINVLWVYSVLDIGVEQGIFAKYGLDVEISVLPGEAKFQQALVAKSIDIGLNSSTSMPVSLRGSPAIAVAAYAGAPRNFSVNVIADSPIETVADLKGKLLATATAGSLPEWLIKRLSTVEGWGVAGIRTTATGGFEATYAATVTHAVDGFMGATEVGLQLEEDKRGRIVTNMERYAPHFITQTISTRTDFVAEHPELVERFLKGFFATVAYVKQNKAPSDEIAMKVLHQSATVVSRAYDAEVSMLSDDGTFDPEGMKLLKQSFVDMGMLDQPPPDDKILTTKFLPVKP
ncbi:MAG TPA: ABC transporter substrate-binding protein [Stellaceae bacterium]|jgi:NitT/TauT family transport system substrate-binding protein